MGKNRNRVKGLANIGALISRAPEAIAPPAEPKGHGITLDGIFDKTIGNMLVMAPPTAREAFKPEVSRILKAALREAFNLGHAAAVGQNNMVDELLAKQYDARTSLTMPAVVAAVMEQTGMDTLVLDLDAVGTVFTRCRLEHDTLADVGHPSTLEYRLIYRADEGLIS